MQATPSAAEPELEIVTPPGVTLSHPAAGGVRVQVRVPERARVLLAIPRAGLGIVLLALFVWGFQHHVFIFVWFMGLPAFLKWLLGPKECALLIGEGALEVEGARWFGGSIVLPRASIARVRVTRSGLAQLFQPALLAHGTDQRVTQLLVGPTTAQLEFVHGGLRRWLAGDG